MTSQQGNDYAIQPAKKVTLLNTGILFADLDLVKLAGKNSNTSSPSLFVITDAPSGYIEVAASAEKL